jgi:plasmid stabilization system protein ParE
VTRPVVFLPAARLELIEAQDWYESEARGLGAQFRAAVGDQVARISANPLAFPVVLRDGRRARLRRFPYSLFFRLLDDATYVIACFHSSRDPRVRQRRVQQPEDACGHCLPPKQDAPTTSLDPALLRPREIPSRARTIGLRTMVMGGLPHPRMSQAGHFATLSGPNSTPESCHPVT